jgi:hypothetical protein
MDGRDIQGYGRDFIIGIINQAGNNFGLPQVLKMAVLQLLCLSGHIIVSIVIAEVVGRQDLVNALASGTAKIPVVELMRRCGQIVATVVTLRLCFYGLLFKHDPDQFTGKGRPGGRIIT